MSNLRQYHYVGKVEEFWPRVEALGIRIEDAQININDMIAFEVEIGTNYITQTIGSLQVEKTNVLSATKGMLAGVQTTFSKEQVKGSRVFVIRGT